MLESMELYQWWIDTMYYLRVIPGSVYEDRLLEVAKNNQQKHGETDINFPTDERQIVQYLNFNNPTGKRQCYLKVDQTTGGIYTVPSQRQGLDALIAEKYAGKYFYNSYLYDAQYSCENRRIIDISELLKTKEANDVFVVDTHDKTYNIYLDIASKKNNCVFFKGLNLNAIHSYFALKTARMGENSNEYRYGKIVASEIVFVDDVCLSIDDEALSSAHISRGLNFNGSTFAGDFLIKGITFDFYNQWLCESEYDSNKLDFRNTRFFGNVSFRDLRFIGDANDMEISFEDARIQNRMEFNNIEFGHVKLNMFQMIFGDYVDHITRKQREAQTKRNTITLRNVSFSGDAEIDFSDVEINNGDIIFQNIPSLPMTKLCFSPIRLFENGERLEDDISPSNYVLIRNCNIENPLYIGNVTELSFRDSHNYNKIVTAKNWGALPDKDGYKKHSRGLFGSKIGSTKIENKMLLAVYNNSHLSKHDFSEGKINYYKAKDFIMLKENFAQEGMYDEEDDAFILYMEKRPYINSVIKNPKKVFEPRKDRKTDFLYKILYQSGKYGISPSRVVSILAIMVLLFTLVYFLFRTFQGADSFTLSNTLSTATHIVEAGWFKNLVDSFLYSLEAIVPFVSQFEPISIGVTLVTALENAIGSFLVGYFSVAVIRKTLR